MDAPGLVQNPPVRLATPADAAALADLAARVLPRGWDLEAFQAEFSRADSRVWVAPGAPAAAPLAGGLVGRCSDEEIEILWVAVDADSRRVGHGRRLLGAAIGLAAPLGAVVRLEVSAANESATALYRRAGFVVVGRRPRYYRDGQDALLMTRAPDHPGVGVDGRRM